MDRLIDQLIEFLREHNALDSFIYNLKRRKSKTKVGGSRFIIGYAFDWEMTSEGFDFWRALNDKWAMLYLNNGKVDLSNLAQQIEEKLEMEKELWTD